MRAPPAPSSPDHTSIVVSRGSKSCGRSPLTRVYRFGVAPKIFLFGTVVFSRPAGRCGAWGPLRCGSTVPGKALRCPRPRAPVGSAPPGQRQLFPPDGSSTGNGSRGRRGFAGPGWRRSILRSAGHDTREPLVIVAGTVARMLPAPALRDRPATHQGPTVRAEVCAALGRALLLLHWPSDRRLQKSDRDLVVPTLEQGSPLPLEPNSTGTAIGTPPAFPPAPPPCRPRPPPLPRVSPTSCTPSSPTCRPAPCCCSPRSPPSLRCSPGGPHTTPCAACTGSPLRPG